MASDVADPAAVTDAPERIATIVVCATCRRAGDGDAEPRPGALLFAATAELAPADISVRSVVCLANCKRSLSAAIRTPTSWSYVFGDLSPDDGPALVEGARLLTAAPDGLMPWRGRPDVLKRGLVARIPPFDDLR